MEVKTVELTAEQEAKVSQRICPFCNGSLRDLVPQSNPNKGELYCGHCHWSYPLFRRL